MGNIIFNSGVRAPDPVPNPNPILVPNPDSVSNPELPKTKDELLSKFGPPTAITRQVDGFFAICYEEDRFLMGGLRNKFTERMVWTIENKQKIAYLNGDQVLKIFG